MVETIARICERRRGCNTDAGRELRVHYGESPVREGQTGGLA